MPLIVSHFIGRLAQQDFVVANDDGKSEMGDKLFSKIELICTLVDDITKWTDIVLARINPPLKRNLPQLKGYPTVDEVVSIVGYGSTNFSDKIDASSDTIKQHQVEFIDQENCRDLFNKRANEGNSICAKGTKKLFSLLGSAKGHSCLNDAGSPLIGRAKAKSNVENAIKAIVSNMDFEKPCLRQVVSFLFF